MSIMYPNWFGVWQLWCEVLCLMVRRTSSTLRACSDHYILYFRSVRYSTTECSFQSVYRWWFCRICYSDTSMFCKLARGIYSEIHSPMDVAEGWTQACGQGEDTLAYCSHACSHVQQQWCALYGGWEYEGCFREVVCQVQGGLGICRPCPCLREIGKFFSSSSFMNKLLNLIWIFLHLISHSWIRWNYASLCILLKKIWALISHDTSVCTTCSIGYLTSTTT